ncbi:MAG: M48 family metallopeptidase [Planctomycetia bacterium]|nr:M48 family metallopeptidase [Planctomycetia bacterium]
MNFFQQQDHARAQTRWMLGAFCIAVILTVVAINAMVLYGVFFVNNYASETDSTYQAYADSYIMTQSDFFYITTITTGLVLLVIGGGTLYKMAVLSSGGEAVAQMMGARRVDPGTTDAEERRLLNVVQEMSLASGVSVPSVYVMDDEMTINAFAAGFSSDDAVIAVTHGCLTLLTRDELQGVIAHEFSHILNGDMKLNLRLMGLLYGLFVLFLVGWYILRNIYFFRSGEDNKQGGGVLAVVIFALGLMVIGSVSWFFGQIIKAAISRQREFLADASAVQFTRYPDGIAGALKKIGGINSNFRAMHSGNAPEVSHMFMVSAFGSTLAGLLSTHPSLTERIKRIDPHFDGKYPPISVEGYYVQASGNELLGQNSSVNRSGEISASTVLEGAGGKQIAIAAMILSALNESVVHATEDSFSAQALVYAALLDRKHLELREKQLQFLKENIPLEIYSHLLKIVPEVDALEEIKFLPLVELAIPVLKQMSEPQYMAFRRGVMQMINADSRVDLWEYALQAMLFRNLDIHFGKRPQSRAKFYGWKNEILQDAARVLSRLAWSGSNDVLEAQNAFCSAVSVLEYPDLTIYPSEECGLKKLDVSLRRLDALAPKLKETFLNACYACINTDGVIIMEEAQLIHVIAAVLGVPVPPMDVQAK